MPRIWVLEPMRIQGRNVVFIFGGFERIVEQYANIFGFDQLQFPNSDQTFTLFDTHVLAGQHRYAEHRYEGSLSVSALRPAGPQSD